MASSIVKRQLSSSTAYAALKNIGRVSMDDVETLNEAAEPGSGKKWKDNATNLEKKAEEMFAGKVTKMAIQGGLAHPSSKDRDETGKVLTVAFYTENGTRYASGHACENGELKLWASRRGSASKPL